MNKALKNFLTVILIMLLISSAYSILRRPEEPEKIGFNTLVAEILDEKVGKVEVEGNNLTVTLKPESEGGETKKQTTRKESESSLAEILTTYGVDPQKIAQVEIEAKEPSGFFYWLSVLLPIFLPFIFIGLLFWFMIRQAQRGNMQAFSFGKSQARMVDPTDKKNRVTFADVAGLKEAKEELEEVVEFLKHPKKFLELGAKIPKGVLLVGSPGTGKTMLAKAVAGEANVPFFNMSGSEFVELFVGVGASRVRDLFKEAKRHAPAIVFIDEIDAVGRHRGAGLGGGHDEREQTLNQILVEMDGFDTDTNVIIIAATNRPDILDPALLRPGRFDRRVTLDEPDINDREEILKIHAKGKPLAEDVSLRGVAERTPGFSGADLANLVNEGAILTARRGKKIIGQNELFESIEKVMLGPERKSRVITKKEKEITAYHEAGHALVAASLPNADPVHKISIIARGQAGGYTLKLPLEDRRLRSRGEFITDLAVMLGGFVAEGIVFGDITTGASNDLEKASDLARKLVTRFGMSEKLGPITFGERQEMIFLGKEISTEKNYSESVAKLIDEEVERFIMDAKKTAEKTITTHRAKLNLIAKTLMEKETLEREEFAALMKA
ncbi:MAG: ATP-dependent zinc metalloprotease FtsH [bacterium]|nr:ATP-dependent zinc metalloprotease FtsH [bacterium]